MNFPTSYFEDRPHDGLQQQQQHVLDDSGSNNDNYVIIDDGYKGHTSNTFVYEAGYHGENDEKKEQQYPEVDEMGDTTYTDVAEIVYYSADFYKYNEEYDR